MWTCERSLTMLKLSPGAPLRVFGVAVQQIFAPGRAASMIFLTRAFARSLRGPPGGCRCRSLAVDRHFVQGAANLFERLVDVGSLGHAVGPHFDAAAATSCDRRMNSLVSSMFLDHRRSATGIRKRSQSDQFDAAVGEPRGDSLRWASLSDGSTPCLCEVRNSRRRIRWPCKFLMSVGKSHSAPHM